MRITNSMMMNNFMGNINRNMTLLERYQNQLSSGRKITRLSDDPIGIMAGLDARAKIRKLEMHNASIGDAKSWLTQTESSLREINEMIVTAYENAVGVANGTMSPDDRQAAAELMEQVRQHVVQLGNATYGGRYIFGGYNTTQAPFTYDATDTLLYNGADLITAPAVQTEALLAQKIEYSTGVNVNTTVSINGVELMGVGADNLNKILGDLVDAMKSGSDSYDTFGPFIGLLQGKQQDTLALLADVGGRINRLDMMENANGENELNYIETLSKIEDIDVAQVTMEFKMAEAVYRSALAVGARVIQPTLMDFLR